VSGADRADADVPAREDQLEGPADGDAVLGARAELAAHDGQARADWPFYYSDCQSEIDIFIFQQVLYFYFGQQTLLASISQIVVAVISLLLYLQR